VTLGEARRGALRAAIGELDRAEQCAFQPIAGLLVDLLVGLAELGERHAEALDRARYGVEQPLSCVRGRVGHPIQTSGATPMQRRFDRVSKDRSTVDVVVR